MIGIAGLTRAQVGPKALVCIYDDKWDNHQQVAIATTEVDLSTNVAVIGCIPNYNTKHLNPSNKQRRAPKPNKAWCTLTHWIDNWIIKFSKS
ncbi:unnamed protein product [Prunus armeniaca]